MERKELISNIVTSMEKEELINTTDFSLEECKENIASIIEQELKDYIIVKGELL